MTLRVVMIAGETSGDLLGAQVLSSLKKRVPNLKVSGVGGQAMLGLGLKLVFPMEELTVLGLGEALWSYRRLKKQARVLMDHIFVTQPDVIVTIDNKGFSLRLGKALKAEMAAKGWSAPIVHMVAPTVWAWGAWRAKAVAQSVDRLLCLFPFEVPYFTCHGVDAVAVGHPSVKEKRPSRAKARQGLGLGQSDQALAILPGSRRREIKALLPSMRDAVRLIRRTHPSLKVYLPVVEAVRDEIEAFISDDDNFTLARQDQAKTVMSACDFGLICSGTVTLEAALCGLPGHVYYKVDALTYCIGRMMLDQSKIVLANAVSGQKIYPLSLNQKANALAMALASLDYFERGDHFAQGGDHSSVIKSSLKTGKGSFAENSSDAILSMLKGD
jgi:lipid-A-disaccharide synthase